MDPRVEGSEVRTLPRAFINKRGEAILIQQFHDRLCQQLIQMYLAYCPRNAFQGLPPINDDACVRWVQHMIKTGVNLVAASFESGIVGHLGLFPATEGVCELLVAVSPAFQDSGIGTELTQSAVHVAYEIGFEEIRLDVDSTNVRARHVYKKCGFSYLNGTSPRELQMALELSRYCEVIAVGVTEIMARNVIALSADDSCRKALDLFLSYRLSALPVVDQQGRFQGILSESELLQPANLDKKVRDIFARQVVVGHEDWTVARLVRLFRFSGVRYVPIIDGQERLVGVVGRKDVLAHYARRLPCASDV